MPAHQRSTAGRRHATLGALEAPLTDAIVEFIERAKTLFADSIETNAEAADLQAGPISDAAQAVVGSLLDGGKVLSCGNGCSAADAQYFAAQMQHRFERERPALPAIALNSDAAILTAIALDEGFSTIFAKQIGALGHPGDILLAFSISGSAVNTVAAVQAAQDRQMKIVALTGCGGGDLAESLRPVDIEIRTPSDTTSRILENHRLAIHCLCDLIDLQLMGG